MFWSINKMPYLYFTAVLFSMSRLNEAASLAQENAENQFDYAQIIPPLVFENVTMENVFVFGGTVPIHYQFDIADLLAPIDSLVSHLLPQEVCTRSEMLQVFCARVQKGTLDIQKELDPNFTKRKMRVLREISNASGRPAALPNEMEMNGTTDCLQPIKREEESFNRQVAVSAKSSLAQLTKRGNRLESDSVTDMGTALVQKLNSQLRGHIRLFKDTLSACQMNYVPQRFINPAALHNDLRNLNRKLEGSSFEVAVPFEKIAELSLTDCVVRNGVLHLTVHVPVRQPGNWTLQTAKSIPFMFNGEKCRVTPSENITATWVAVVDTRKSIIEELDSQRIGGGLFVALQDDSDSLEENPCMFAILNNHSSSELKQVCPFSCTSNDSLVSITPLEGAKYLLTGANTMNMSCAAGVKHIAFPDYGSVQINLDVCKCRIRISGNKDTRNIESSRRSCIRKKKGFPETVHVIPSQWTLYSATDLQQRLTSLNQVFNRNWKQIVPHLREERSKKEMEDIPRTRQARINFQEERVEGPSKEIVGVQGKTPAETSPWYDWAIACAVFGIAILLVLGLACILRCTTAAIARMTKQPAQRIARAYQTGRTGEV